MSDRGGQHAASDGSFSRSAGGAMARGIGLILVAVLLGVVLLKASDSPEPFQEQVASSDGGTEVTAGPSDEGGDETTSTTSPAVARPPAEVAVLVANGSGVAGAATRVAQKINSSGFVLRDPTNTTTPAEGSFVYFAPGYEADAKAVASLLTPTPTVQPMPDPLPVKDLAGANVLVVVAADLAGGA